MSEFSSNINSSEFEIIKPITSPDRPKTPQELTEERKQRLELLVADPNFDTTLTTSVDRVRDFLEHENDFQRKPWDQYLKNIEDWKLYYQINPEWHGLNTKEVIKFSKDSKNFWVAFHRWTEHQTDVDPKKLRQEIFPPIRKSYQNYTDNDYVEEFNRHPEWKDFNTSQMDSFSKESKNFYASFSRYANRQAKLGKNRNEIIRLIFPSDEQNWKDLKVIEDWQKYFIENHKRNFDGKKISELSPYDRKFYNAVSEWLDKETKNMNPTEAAEFKKNARQIIFHQEITPQLETQTNLSNVTVGSSNKDTIPPQPQITTIILPSNPIDFSEQENLPNNFINGITTEVIDTTSEAKETENGNNNGNYKNPFITELTSAQIIRLMCGTGEWNGELYQQHSGEIASYLINRGEIAYLLNYFSKTNQQFPKTIVDLGSGPSIGYNAYQEFQPELERSGITAPTVIDVEKNESMFTYGNNPNKIQQDITKPLPFSDKQVDLVQSTFVFHWLKPQETLQSLIETNRITKIGGHLCLICREPFSNSFISAVEQLGYQVITEHGEILSPNQKMLDAITQQSDLQHADRLKNKFKKAFILFAKKETDISEITNLPSSENFTYDHVKKATRERKPIVNIKNASSPLAENLDDIKKRINNSIKYLLDTPIKHEGQLTPSANEITDGLYDFNQQLKQINDLYQEIKNKIRISQIIATKDQLSQLAEIKKQLDQCEQLKRDYKKLNSHSKRNTINF